MLPSLCFIPPALFKRVTRFATPADLNHLVKKMVRLNVPEQDGSCQWSELGPGRLCAGRSRCGTVAGFILQGVPVPGKVDTNRHHEARLKDPVCQPQPQPLLFTILGPSWVTSDLGIRPAYREEPDVYSEVVSNSSPCCSLAHDHSQRELSGPRNCPDEHSITPENTTLYFGQRSFWEQH